MNRFLPDGLLEWLLRPIAMAAPNAWVYVEVIAPDFKLLFLLILLLPCATAVLRKRAALDKSLLATGGLLAAMFALWLMTSGNGRYFMPGLMVSGVLCIAMVHLLPATRGFRVTLALALCLAQGYAVSQNNPWRPWNSWGMFTWTDAPYFHIDESATADSEASTFVGLSVISYSLLAPQFPSTTAWINLSALQDVSGDSEDAVRVRQHLVSAKRLELLVPSIPSVTSASGAPTSDAARSLDVLLARHGLQIADHASCRMLRSATLEASLLAQQPGHKDVSVGFWRCDLRVTTTDASPSASLPADVDSVLRALETRCPHVFPRGLTGATPIAHGTMRHYQATDMKVYVHDDGNVFSKHFRQVSPQFLGTVTELINDGSKLDCASLVPSKLPWARGI